MFDQIGDGVFRRRFQSLDLNVGVVIGSDGVLIVDTRASGAQGRELMAELRQLTRLPVRWVVNTHWHWDHVLGNEVFDEAEIIAHEICGRVLTERGEETKQAATEWMPPGDHADISRTVVVPPSTVFADRLSVDIGRVVELGHHGRGHTDADITIDVPDAGVLFMGDLVEEGAPPAFGDSYPLSWPSTLESASPTGDAVIVPGHGDVVGPAFVAEQRAELSSVAEAGSRLLSGDIDLARAVGSGPYPEEVMRTAMTRVMETA